MSGLSIREIARALGGEVSGHRVLAPGPGHSRIDRSLSVRLSSTAPGGFVVKSFAEDDFAACRDHVGAALGLPSGYWRTTGKTPVVAPLSISPRANPARERDNADRIALAVAIWEEAGDARGTIVERYLASRRLELPGGAEVLRFHPRCPWRDEVEDRTIFVSCMIVALRSIGSDKITGIHRTRLSPVGEKLGRRMLGIAAGAAAKLDGDDTVSSGLAIGEGVESCIAARQLGFRPTWALASAGAIASFPLLAGIETLTVLSENDPASDRAVEQVSSLWLAAGREVAIISPTLGSDLNDAIRGAA